MSEYFFALITRVIFATFVHRLLVAKQCGKSHEAVAAAVEAYDEDCGDDDADDDADENDNDQEDDERRRSEKTSAVVAAATKVLYRSMEIPDLPAFPVPPALILPPSININKHNNGNNNDSTTIDSEHCNRHHGPGSRRHQRHHRHHRHRGVDKMPNRPRTTSWLMQRRNNNNNNDGNDYSNSSNNNANNNVNNNAVSSKWQRARGGNVRVQPIFWRRVSRPQVEWKLRQAKATTDDDDDPNGNPNEIHSSELLSLKLARRSSPDRLSPRSNMLKKFSRRSSSYSADETQCTSDVVTPTLTAIVKQDGLLSAAAAINHRYSSQLGGGGELQAASLLHVQDDALIAQSIECGGVGGSSSLLQLQHRVSCATYKSAASQTSDRVLYRLRVLPTLRDIVDEETTIKATTAAGRNLGSGPGPPEQPPAKRKASRLGRYFRFLGRVALCQFGAY
ncbi:unnamed protein product [Trichogramma brassicae]|uniref:Uncharacterized protein n=1 Tax=Trichogramma brassicae TaxID=86971 RepID=A0A6H5IZB4_9HYME|nr:unnamed protein product [Trichogramma brassicae]